MCGPHHHRLHCLTEGQEDEKSANCWKIMPGVQETLEENFLPIINKNSIIHSFYHSFNNWFPSFNFFKPISGLFFFEKSLYNIFSPKYAGTQTPTTIDETDLLAELLCQGLSEFNKIFRGVLDVKLPKLKKDLAKVRDTFGLWSFYLLFLGFHVKKSNDVLFFFIEKVNGYSIVLLYLSNIKKVNLFPIFHFYLLFNL